MDDPVDPAIVDELRTRFPDFVRAFEPDGLSPEEFDTFGPTARTLRAFIGSYHELLHQVGDALVPNPDVRPAPMTEPAIHPSAPPNDLPPDRLRLRPDADGRGRGRPGARRLALPVVPDASRSAAGGSVDDRRPDHETAVVLVVRLATSIVERATGEPVVLEGRASVVRRPAVGVLPAGRTAGDGRAVTGGGRATGPTGSRSPRPRPGRDGRAPPAPIAIRPERHPSSRSAAPGTRPARSTTSSRPTFPADRLWSSRS